MSKEIDLEECEMQEQNCLTHEEDCKPLRAAFEHSAKARPKTQGEYRWNNNPLEDRVIDY